MTSTSGNSSDESTHPPPKQRTDFFDYFRCFTNRHIASVLHSLIGLPTMLPPPSSAWVMDDESLQATTTTTANPTDQNPNPSAVAAAAAAAAAGGSSSIITATEALKKEKSLPPQSQSTRGRMAECYLLTDPRTTASAISMFRPEEEVRLAAVWRQVSLLHRDFAAPFFGGDVFGTGMGKGAGQWQDPFLIAPLFWSVGGNRRTSEAAAATAGEDEVEEVNDQTEMDAYNHLAPVAAASTFFASSSSSPPPPSQLQSAEDPNKPQVIATVATARSYTSPDGVTRTKYVLKKRFADGSEEKVEEDRTSAPEQQRITEK